ncbi:MAG: pyrroline-5-carboxylate reductase [Verrucomicrobiota bacterium]
MKLGIIGTGRMAQAIVGGILKDRSLAPDQITGTDPNEVSKTSFLNLSFGEPLQWADSIGSLVNNQDAILLAVKPQNIDEILPIVANSPETTTVISIAAGVSLTKLQDHLGETRPVIRVMPNTPLLVGNGVVAWCGNDHIATPQKEMIAVLFGGVAEVHQVAESEMDAVTALSGSGPAFFYRIIQYLEAAAVAEGLHPDRARALATGTAAGAVKMLQSTGLEPDELVAQVRSKGGTTEAGLNVLESGEAQTMLTKTIAAAARRSRELG